MWEFGLRIRGFGEVSGPSGGDIRTLRVKLCPTASTRASGVLPVPVLGTLTVLYRMISLPNDQTPTEWSDRKIKILTQKNNFWHQKSIFEIENPMFNTKNQFLTRKTQFLIPKINFWYEEPNFDTKNQFLTRKTNFFTPKINFGHEKLIFDTKNQFLTRKT